MERLTYRLGEQNPSYGLVDKASAKPGLFTDYDGFYAHLQASHRLGQYEDTGLTPEEISAMQAENATLKKALDVALESIKKGLCYEDVVAVVKIVQEHCDRQKAREADGQ